MLAVLTAGNNIACYFDEGQIYTDIKYILKNRFLLRRNDKKKFMARRRRAINKYTC